jgi:hypothetical protein
MYRFIDSMESKKEEANNFDLLSKIYSQFTAENKDNLLETAKTLLKVQKKNKRLIHKLNKES